MYADPGLPVWHTASIRGARSVNADAVASSTGPAGQVVALADGIGDHRGAARAALVAASAAVRAPVADGPVAALAAAQEAVLADPEAADCVIVVAQPTAASYKIAWVGDVRAYAWTGVDLHQVTTDHTVAQYFRAHGTPVTPRMEHTVLTSMRIATPASFGHTSLPIPAGLLLTTDGVHRTLSHSTMADLIRYRADPAAALVAAAREAGATDNATAALLDHTHLPPTLPIAA